MRIAVVSDTHGSARGIELAVSSAGEADAWFHLGDVLSDSSAIARLTGKQVYSVKGNCDYGKESTELVVTLDGVRFLLTHGHALGVKQDLMRLYYRAEELRCTVALYGHTHIPSINAWRGILAVNPGSPNLPRGSASASIAMLKVEDAQVYPMIVPV